MEHILFLRTCHILLSSTDLVQLIHRPGKLLGGHIEGSLLEFTPGLGHRGQSEEVDLGTRRTTPLLALRSVSVTTV